MIYEGWMTGCMPFSPSLMFACETLGRRFSVFCVGVKKCSREPKGNGIIPHQECSVACWLFPLGRGPLVPELSWGFAGAWGLVAHSLRQSTKPCIVAYLESIQHICEPPLHCKHKLDINAFIARLPSVVPENNNSQALLPEITQWRCGFVVYVLHSPTPHRC